MSADHDHNPIPRYLAVFNFLVAVTAFELLPLFGLMNIPAPLLLALSAIKFTVVVLFFMHLWGDKGINNRLFFIPLLMAGGSVAVIMSIFGTWSLQWPVRTQIDPVTGEKVEVRDGEDVIARYRGRWTGECNAWIQSSITGNTYCSSPWVAYSTQPAYDALKVVVAAADPAFAGWDTKTPEDKKAVLMKKGEEVYASNCGACHQASGLGLAGNFPPLAADPVANGGDVTDHINIVLKGLNGRVINGVTYAAAMQPWAATLNDEQIAAVITYERNAWGNNGGVVEPAQVAALR